MIARLILLREGFWKWEKWHRQVTGEKHKRGSVADEINVSKNFKLQNVIKNKFVLSEKKIGTTIAYIHDRNIQA